MNDSGKRELLLEVKNLETHFSTEDGLVKAVDDVSFDVYRGETVGIVGESGSGKSVTSLSIMRLIPNPPGKIAGGQILYHPSTGGAPIDLVTLPDAEMRKYRGNEIAMIFQEPMTSLNPVFTCGNQVSEAITLHQKVSNSRARELTIELFDQVQLPDPQRMFSAYPHQLSGGQKQRVMIAMAMSCNPGILIADEPTTALDVTVQKTILDLMSNLKEKINSSVIFITHDLGVIAEVADRVVVMYKGKIVEQGTVLEIFENPKHPYTKGLLACRPPLGKRLSKLPVIDDFMEISGDGKLIEKESSMEKLIDSVTISPTATKNRMLELEAKEPMLKVRNLKTWFPSKRNIFGKVLENVKAVDDVSFDVYPGETLGLVGESGCGKTTLGRTIIRLIDPIGGEIELNGKDLIDITKADLKRL
ncbi:MAG: peptide/nickel transport system ATP-binding protein, partial [Limisphaerales bacterium]